MGFRAPSSYIRHSQLIVDSSMRQEQERKEEICTHNDGHPDDKVVCPTATVTQLVSRVLEFNAQPTGTVF